MFKEKYLKIKDIEKDMYILKEECASLAAKQMDIFRDISTKQREVVIIKNEIAQDLKKISTNVWIDIPNGPVLITYVRGRLGEDLVFFNTGKTEAEAEKLLMLAKLEGK